MERIPRGRYSKEFRIEAVKLVTEDHMLLPEAGRRLNCISSLIIRLIQRIQETVTLLRKLRSSGHPMFKSI